MIKELFSRQSGGLHPREFKTIHMSNRSRTLCASNQPDVDQVHTSTITSMDLDKVEFKYLLSGCLNGDIFIHDLHNYTGKTEDNCKCISRISNNRPPKFGISAVSWYGVDNGLFISSSNGPALKVWDTNNLRAVESYKATGNIIHHHLSQVPSRNPVVAVGTDRYSVELFDLRTGGCVHVLKGENCSVYACCWSPRDEHLLVTGSRDGKIIMWDTRASNGFLKTLDPLNSDSKRGVAHRGIVNSLKFTSDGLTLVSFGTDCEVRVWETLHGNNQMINFGKMINKERRNIQIDIANKSHPPLLYVPSEGIYILEMFTGKIVKILNGGHFYKANCCSYNEPYQQLYSCGKDPVIIRWTPDKYIDDETTLSDYKPVLIEDAWSDNDDY